MNDGAEVFCQEICGEVGSAVGTTVRTDDGFADVEGTLVGDADGTLVGDAAMRRCVSFCIECSKCIRRRTDRFH